jgi:hypothetical protein
MAAPFRRQPLSHTLVPLSRLNVTPQRILAETTIAQSDRLVASQANKLPYPTTRIPIPITISAIILSSPTSLRDVRA